MIRTEGFEILIFYLPKNRHHETFFRQLSFKKGRPLMRSTKQMWITSGTRLIDGLGCEWASFLHAR
jgi:hypothetical protein